MGIYSDNFYSWLDRQNKVSRTVMDEGYKHPDGKPCKAKNKKNCPFYKEELEESSEIDDLKSLAKLVVWRV